jgi:hypothetical protein
MKLIIPIVETFSLFSDQYNKLFVENYQAYAENIKKNENNALINKKYSLFFPSCGSKDKKDILFMIYGQAANGWTPTFQVNNLRNGLLKEAIEYSNTTDKGENCPLDWINKRWSSLKLGRKFFFNVMYKLVNRYNDSGIDDENWCKNVVWSNLMKISPAAGGNPYGAEWTCQFEGAKKLFTKEIEEIKPKFVIILTNWDWAEDFLKNNTGFMVDEKTQGEFIQAIGKYRNVTQIIVTKRPRVGNNEQCVVEIIQLTK